MKLTKVFSALFVAVTIAMNQGSTQADIVGDQKWVTPIDSSPTYHSMLFADELSAVSTYPRLTAEQYTSDPTVWNRFLCSSTADAHCQNMSQFSYQSIFPICKVAADQDCIEGLSATSDQGITQEGQFVGYTVPDHVNKFLSDPSLDIPKTETPSLWDLPIAKHQYGNQYALVVGQTGSVRTGEYGNNSQSQLYAYLLPVSEVAVGYVRNESPLHVGYDSIWEAKDSTGRVNTPGYAVATDSCTMSLADPNKCLTSHQFPEGFRFTIKVRLSKEPVAWLHGRLVDPNISISKVNNQINLTVSASPTKVPILWVGTDSSKLNTDQENLWVSCFTQGTCSAGGTKDGRPIDFKRTFDSEYSKTLNLWAIMYQYGTTAIKGIQLLTPLTGDKSVAVPGAWSFHTLPSNQLDKANSCFKSGVGVKGIVTTNSTAYSEGPPAFSDGSLQYTVASPHFNPDGTVFKGTYNLVMRSDVARCLYSFSKAPIKASISVVAADGTNDVATTTSNEKDGWLYLSANNFTFSSPTVRVALSQEAPAPAASPSPVASATPTPAASGTPAPQVSSAPAPTKASSKTTIVCIKGKSSKSVTAVKPVCPSGYKKK